MHDFPITFQHHIWPPSPERMTERFDFPFVGGTKWFTLKKFNIYGFSVISSMALMVAGCYLVRAQAKNDLDVIRLSAGTV